MAISKRMYKEAITDHTITLLELGNGRYAQVEGIRGRMAESFEWYYDKRTDRVLRNVVIYGKRRKHNLARFLMCIAPGEKTQAYRINKNSKTCLNYLTYNLRTNRK